VNYLLDKHQINSKVLFTRISVALCHAL